MKLTTSSSFNNYVNMVVSHRRLDQAPEIAVSNSVLSFPWFVDSKRQISKEHSDNSMLFTTVTRENLKSFPSKVISPTVLSLR